MVRWQHTEIPGAIIPWPAEAERVERKLGHLLHVEREPAAGNLLVRRFPLLDVLGPTEIPFAEDIGGDLLCFDYRGVRVGWRRRPRPTPPVGFWSTHTGFVPPADDVDAFVAALHD